MYVVYPKFKFNLVSYILSDNTTLISLLLFMILKGIPWHLVLCPFTDIFILFYWDFFSFDYLLVMIIIPYTKIVFNSFTVIQDLLFHLILTKSCDVSRNMHFINDETELGQVSWLAWSHMLLVVDNRFKSRFGVFSRTHFVECIIVFQNYLKSKA